MNTDRHPEEWEKSPAPKIAIAVIAVLMTGLLVILLARREAKTINLPEANFQATQQVIFGEMQEIRGDGVTVYVPPNSMDREGTFSIQSVSASSFEVIDQIGWTRPKVVQVEFRDAAGASIPNAAFFNPIQVCFDLTGEQWQELLLHPDSYQVQYYDEQLSPAQWTSLPKSTHPDRSQLCGATTQLSAFSLLIKVKMEIPVTGATAIPTSYIPATERPTSLPPTSAPAPTKDRNRPGDEPGVINPPTTGPSLTEPPTEPPATEPSATEPPATEPPATDPPATDPPPPTDPPIDPPPTEPPTQPPVGVVP